MNLLTIYPIQSCNLHCEYCPSKRWVYPVNSECNKLNNEIIFKWIDEFLNPEEWMIEISGGGEPGMYPEIDGLVTGLTDRGYYGLIKTNGTLPIPESPNFKRCAAWHLSQDLQHPPKYYDIMIIITNPDDDWKGKEQYCKDNGIPYEIFQYMPFHLKRSEWKPNQFEPLRTNTLITGWTVVYSGGRISKCFSSYSSEDCTIQKMCPPEIKNIPRECPKCENVNKFERFIPQEWIDMFTKATKTEERGE